MQYCTAEVGTDGSHFCGTPFQDCSSPRNLARDDAAKTFQEIANRADHLGFVPYELEPRLALAEIEVNLGDRANAKNHLEALQKEAADRGFGLIAIQAAGDLKNLVPPSRSQE